MGFSHGEREQQQPEQDDVDGGGRGRHGDVDDRRDGIDGDAAGVFDLSGRDILDHSAAAAAASAAPLLLRKRRLRERLVPHGGGRGVRRRRGLDFQEGGELGTGPGDIVIRWNGAFGRKKSH